MRLRILTPGFEATNSGAFVFPILRYRRALTDRGIDVRIHSSLDASFLDADIAWVDAKHHGPIWHEFDRVARDFEQIRAAVDRVDFVDTYDSTGGLKPEILPYVDHYYKSQLLGDRNAYTEMHYGQRLHTDHYHRDHGVVDSEPVTSTPVPHEQLGKLRVSWNTGLANFALFGLTRNRIVRRTGDVRLLTQPARFGHPGGLRPFDVACRMNYDYHRETVAFGRAIVRDALGERCSSVRKLPRAAYLAEMRLSKTVLSPFGWGEINYRDFECFRSGAALVKPDMGHLETWPNWYETGVTYLTHDWGAQDLAGELDRLLQDPARRREIAMMGQARYRDHVTGDAAERAFVDRMESLLGG